MKNSEFGIRNATRPPPRGELLGSQFLPAHPNTNFEFSF
jgi:hypothetical protein